MAHQGEVLRLDSVYTVLARDVTGEGIFQVEKPELQRCSVRCSRFPGRGSLQSVPFQLMNLAAKHA